MDKAVAVAAFAVAGVAITVATRAPAAPEPDATHVHMAPRLHAIGELPVTVPPSHHEDAGREGAEAADAAGSAARVAGGGGGSGEHDGEEGAPEPVRLVSQTVKPWYKKYKVTHVGDVELVDGFVSRACAGAPRSAPLTARDPLQHLVPARLPAQGATPEVRAAASRGRGARLPSAALTPDLARGPVSTRAPARGWRT